MPSLWSLVSVACLLLGCSVPARAFGAAVAGSVALSLGCFALGVAGVVASFQNDEDGGATSADGRQPQPHADYYADERPCVAAKAAAAVLGSRGMLEAKHLLPAVPEVEELAAFGEEAGRMPIDCRVYAVQ